MADNVTDFFNRFGGQPTAPTAPRASEKEAYRAFVPFLASEERVRLRARYSNGKQEYWSYIQLLNIFTDSPGYVGLLFNQGGIWCEGENLGALFNALQENVVKELVAFDAARHEPPPEGSPVIYRLEARRAQTLIEQGAS